MRKLVPVLLLATVLEGAWLLGGLELLRDKAGTGPVGRLTQELKQAKTLIEKASEALKVNPAALEQVLKQAAPLTPADPSRNPFALPEGVRSLAEPAAPADPKASGEVGASTEKDMAKAATPEPPARQLSGILVGPRDRVAIIDGALVRPGDSLEGERVIEIRRDQVVLAREGQRRTLRLPPPFPESGQAAEQVQIRSSADAVPPKRSNGVTEP